jgi:hypothetical protein
VNGFGLGVDGGWDLGGDFVMGLGGDLAIGWFKLALLVYSTLLYMLLRD